MGINTEIHDDGDRTKSSGVTMHWQGTFSPVDGEPISLQFMTTCYMIDRQRSPVLGITLIDSAVYDRLKTGMVGTVEVVEFGAKSGKPRATHRIDDATIVVKTRCLETDKFNVGVVVFVEIPH